MEGAKWNSSIKYNVKLEGARVFGYQTSLLVLLRENSYVKNAREWTEKLSDFLKTEIKLRMNLNISDYRFAFFLRLLLGAGTSISYIFPFMFSAGS